MVGDVVVTMVDKAKKEEPVKPETPKPTTPAPAPSGEATTPAPVTEAPTTPAPVNVVTPQVNNAAPVTTKPLSKTGTAAGSAMVAMMMLLGAGMGLVVARRREMK